MSNNYNTLSTLMGRDQSSEGECIQCRKGGGMGSLGKDFSRSESAWEVVRFLDNLSARQLSQEDSLGWCTTWREKENLTASRQSNLAKIEDMTSEVE